jgi:hypothetical protein
MSTDSRSGVGSRFGWLMAYGIAMGFLEAAVVVYLRELYYPDGFSFPLIQIPARTAVAEIVREATTVVMLLSVAMLAGRDALDRFFVFALLFGVWDLVYYLALYLFLGWPESLLTWDVLFLIPVPWVAPVLYPALVSALLILGYLMFETIRSSGRTVRTTRSEWMVATVGCLVLIVSFCWNWALANAGGTPTSFPVLLFSVGMLLGVAPLARAFWRAIR